MTQNTKTSISLRRRKEITNGKWTKKVEKIKAYAAKDKYSPIPT